MKATLFWALVAAVHVFLGVQHVAWLFEAPSFEHAWKSLGALLGAAVMAYLSVRAFRARRRP